LYLFESLVIEEAGCIFGKIQLLLLNLLSKLPVTGHISAGSQKQHTPGEDSTYIVFRRPPKALKKLGSSLISNDVGECDTTSRKPAYSRTDKNPLLDSD
jgi:hypothetical protein